MRLTELVRRYEGNPILTTKDLPGSEAVFNAGAVKFNGRYILLVSACIVGTSGVGRNIHVAESTDGINFTIRPKPFIEAGTDGPFTQFDYDICDPRITVLEGKIYISYPAHLPGVGIVGVLGTTEDFETFTRIDYLSLPHNRVPIFFPEKINGNYWRLDRPYGFYGGSMWVSQSPDLVYWGKHRMLFNKGSQLWNCEKVGPSGPPIKTSKGWLIVFHGVSGAMMANSAYHQGVALLDLNDPSKVLALPNQYIMTPTLPYEITGRVNNTIFCCGHIVEDGIVKLYYSACDNCIGLATFDLEEMAAACLEHAGDRW